MFKRLHGRDVPGTGIGLTICKRIVDRYGGQIWVESQVDQGATFYFTLPVDEKSATASTRVPTSDGDPDEVAFKVLLRDP